MRRRRPTRHARPAIGQLAELLGRVPAGAVGSTVELAAGTGVLTGALVRAGVAMIAVEADRDARAQLVRSLPGVPALDAESRSLPFAAGSVSALVTTRAQAVSAQDTVDELARVLRPGAPLVVVLDPEGSGGTDGGSPAVVLSGFDVPDRSVHTGEGANGLPLVTELIVWRRSS